MSKKKELSLLRVIKECLSSPSVIKAIKSGEYTTMQAIEACVSVYNATDPTVKPCDTEGYTDTTIPRTDKEEAAALELWKSPEKLKKMLEVIQQGIDKGTKIIDVPYKNTEVFTFSKADKAYLNAFRAVSVTTTCKITVTSLEHNMGGSEVVSIPFVSFFTPKESPETVYVEPSDDFGMVFREVKDLIAAAYSTEDEDEE